MKSLFNLIKFFIFFVIVIFVIDYSWSHFYCNSFHIDGNGFYSGIVGSILASAITVFLAWVAWEQWNKTNTTSSADFIHKLTKDFFTPKARTLISLIECGALNFIGSHPIDGNIELKPYFAVNSDMLKKSHMPEDLIKNLSVRKYYTMWEIDDFLINPLTDVGTLEGRRLLDFQMVYVGFRYYLKTIWSNVEIRRYIQWQRIETKPKSIEHAVSYHFQYITEKCLEYDSLRSGPDKWWWNIKRQFFGFRPKSKIQILTCHEIKEAKMEEAEKQIKDESK